MTNILPVQSEFMRVQIFLFQFKMSKISKMIRWKMFLSLCEDIPGSFSQKYDRVTFAILANRWVLVGKIITNCIASYNMSVLNWTSTKNLKEMSSYVTKEPQTNTKWEVIQMSIIPPDLFHQHWIDVKKMLFLSWFPIVCGSWVFAHVSLE